MKLHSDFEIKTLPQYRPIILNKNEGILKKKMG